MSSFSHKVKEELRKSNEILPSDDVAFLRNEFLRRGSITNPEKSYHLEFAAHFPRLCDDLQTSIRNLGLDCKTTERKGSSIVYLKESEQISDLLTFMGAPLASMELTNIKIEKELRNDLNRAVNAENANLDKTISASMRLLADIRKIENSIGLESLPPELYAVAKLRKKHKDISIAELGQKLAPPLTKSGTQNRLRKISAIAEKV
ncbi:MAG: DNA-binding protein WhiA [Oscillospiraceae bacterium]|nr:DNA-binding protein WhiA [Oscillospiraceae bacterium]